MLAWFCFTVAPFHHWLTLWANSCTVTCCCFYFSDKLRRQDALRRASRVIRNIRKGKVSIYAVYLVRAWRRKNSIKKKNGSSSVFRYREMLVLKIYRESKATEEDKIHASYGPGWSCNKHSCRIGFLKARVLVFFPWNAIIFEVPLMPIGISRKECKDRN